MKDGFCLGNGKDEIENGLTEAKRIDDDPFFFKFFSSYSSSENKVRSSIL